MTKSSEYDCITNELLSAYIDDAVTEQERTLVDSAVATDAEVAWRLDTLQQTVLLLRSLPEIALPRSFAITEADLVASSTRQATASQAEQPTFLGQISGALRSFWGQGAGVYRNLAAASLALMLVLVGATGFFGISDIGMTENLSDSVAPEFEMAQVSEEPAFAPAPEVDTGIEKTEAVANSEETADSAAELSTADDSDEMNALAVSPTVGPPIVAAAAVPAPLNIEGVERSASDEVAASESAPVAEQEMSAAMVAEDTDSAIEPAMSTGIGIARSAPQPAKPGSAPAIPYDALLDEVALAAIEEVPAEPEAYSVMADTETVAETTTADTIEEDSAAVVEEMKEQADEHKLESVAALPEPMNGLPSTSAQVSPLGYPYPPPPETTPFLQMQDFKTLNIIILGLFALTVVFGGLWWRSRDYSDTKR